MTGPSPTSAFSCRRSRAGHGPCPPGLPGPGASNASGGRPAPDAAWAGRRQRATRFAPPRARLRAARRTAPRRDHRATDGRAGGITGNRRAASGIDTLGTQQGGFARGEERFSILNNVPFQDVPPAATSDSHFAKMCRTWVLLLELQQRQRASWVDDKRRLCGRDSLFLEDRSAECPSSPQTFAFLTWM